jgi:carboxypeptidase C (cathepsin A)
VCGDDLRRRQLNHKNGSNHSLQDALEALAAPEVTVETAQSFRVSAGYEEALNGYACGAQTAMDAWLAEPSVIEALHVKSDTVGMQYIKTATDMLPLYADQIEKGYQMLIYSGDVDGCVPYVGTENWTRNLGYPVTKEWHQWLAKPDMEHAIHKAGYAITFNKFQFITISGAGHMVPQFQPGFGLAMFEKFLTGETF